MTLATILSICIFCSAGTGEPILASLSAVPPIAESPWARPGGQQTPASNQDNPSSSQSVPASPTPAPSVSSPAQVSSGQEKTKATKGKRRNSKKTNSANASPNPSANCTPAAASSTAAADATTTSSAQTPPLQPTPLPPTARRLRQIVRQKKRSSTRVGLPNRPSSFSVARAERKLHNNAIPPINCWDRSKMI